MLSLFQGCAHAAAEASRGNPSTARAKVACVSSAEKSRDVCAQMGGGGHQREDLHKRSF